MDEKQLETIVNAIVKELVEIGAARLPEQSPNLGEEHPGSQPDRSALSQPAKSKNLAISPSAGEKVVGGAQPESADTQSLSSLRIDLPDPTTEEMSKTPWLEAPSDPEGLAALMNATPARIGQGRSGPRYRTRPWLLFQADQAVTQDTLFRDVDESLLQQLGLFKVQTRITTGKEEYLLRPDLGRQLSDEAKQTILERCQKTPDVQVCAGDGLSAQAIEVNLPQILPVIQQGCQAAGLTLGTPFFIQYCRVGVMNDIGDLLQPKVLMLLIGERPGLGRADSMSVYMGYRPQAGHTDGERDVICNIYDRGTNPLEAGAYSVQMAQKMIQMQASGVRLKMMEK